MVVGKADTAELVETIGMHKEIVVVVAADGIAAVAVVVVAHSFLVSVSVRSLAVSHSFQTASDRCRHFG